MRGRWTSHTHSAWAVLLLAHPCSLCSVPDDYRCGKALGPVESLQGHLRDPTKILIGYSRGLLVIWNQAAQCADRIFLGNQVCVRDWCPQLGPSAQAALLTPVHLSPQQLESLCWERSGSILVSSHSDGSYAIWSVDTGSSPVTQPTVATMPYGEHWTGQGQPCCLSTKAGTRGCPVFVGAFRRTYGKRQHQAKSAKARLPGVGHSQGRWAFSSGRQEAAPRQGLVGAAWERENG